jgi:hypothetical protein
LDKILYGDNVIEDDPDSMILNPVFSTISKWWTFKFLRWGQHMNQLLDLDEIVYEGDDIEYYLDYILHNPVASTVSKWQMLKLLRWVLH